MFRAERSVVFVTWSEQWLEGRRKGKEGFYLRFLSFMDSLGDEQGLFL